MNYFAHSPKDGVEAQTYAAHIRGVCHLADRFGREAGKYSKSDGEALRRLVEKAAEYHDIGKLDEKNQAVLSGKVKAKSLPVNHVDAGAAHWLTQSSLSPLAASAIQAHHIGFPDYSEEYNKGDRMFRDLAIAADIDKKLSSYEAVQSSTIGHLYADKAEIKPQGDPSMFMRMLLSCLADADHTNTAQHYGQYPADEQIVGLRAEERLAQLDACIETLRVDSASTTRNELRNQMYRECRDTSMTSWISSCDSPVGSGKTTAVMAHLLRQAQQRGLRRVFVVLPFTNIIRQSVETYRKMLVLPGENPEEVVAELHHRADFESEDARHLTALWRAPIIVTTAVAFFETISSNSTATLRRLHELPGSAIFVDESHAALPAHLLPIAWRWIRLLSNEWSCYWVLASGSLSRFWTVRDIVGDEIDTGVAEIVSDKTRCKLSSYEINRLSYRHDMTPKNTAQLAKWISSFPGPRLVIMNTVQSAAVLAEHLANHVGRKQVEHISTALTPDDRDAALERVKSRLKDKTDTDWTLVATSCVEAGMDISFRTGFHELSSLSSLLQAAGRVNREGEFADAEMWTFQIVEDGMLKLNPGLKQTGNVLKSYLDKGMQISPALTTKSLSDEIAMYGLGGKNRRLIESEKVQNFIRVERDFKVIDSDTKLAVVDEGLIARLQSGEINWKELQRVSVRISKYKLLELGMPKIIDDIYLWNLEYDRFLGYMAGVIKRKQYNGEAIIV
ncbi:CRISPR-associated endonuclease Cas3'' [Yanshouia hominis]|uniref:CRISPR-associated endonuclease Cas3 n=1 Tax=Yanshouia hominis TaxID=2763673 RepID=A0ABR7NN10_9FIRM|nr:CRISPR-associated endonuclease Cas3'' [Yanshouia hominis]MBC8577792.1 CRISPR-associated endonuclease Cas3'' [Yanshouia hominis]